MAKDRGDSGGVSLSAKDAIVTGGFGPGPATIVRARWQQFEYIKKGQRNGKIAEVLLVTYERDGEQEKVPYGIGGGWKITDKGMRLKALKNQTGLPKNCNALYFIDSLEHAEGIPMPGDYLRTPDQLEGAEVVLKIKPVERDFQEDKKTGQKGGVRTDSVLIVTEVTAAPWEKGSKKKKKKDEDEDDDEDQDDSDDSDDSDDDDEDEKPKKKKGKSDDDDDDEDDDEDFESDGDDEDEDDKPKKKKKPADEDDDEDEDDDDDKPAGKKRSAGDEDIDEAAVEALTDLLEEEEEMLVADIEDALLKRLKKAKVPNYDEIAARAIEEDFLDGEKGWTRKGKKVTLDK